MEQDDSLEKQDSVVAWKALASLLLGYRRNVAIVVVLGLVSAFANGAVPFVVGKFFDSLITPYEINVILLTVSAWLVFLLLWAGVQLFANASDWLLSVQASWMGSQSHADYLAKASSHLLYVPISFHRENKVGELQRRVQDAAIGAGNILERVVVTLVPQFASIIIGLAFVVRIEMAAAIILIGGVIAYVLFLFRVAPKAITRRRASYDAYSNAYGVVWDAILNIQAVKQFAAEHYFARQIHHVFVEVSARLTHKVNRIWASITFAQGVTTLATMAAIFVLSAVRISSGDMTAGELVALNGYAMMIFGPFAALGMNWQTIQDGLVAIEKSEKEVRKLPTEPYEKGGDAEYPRALSGNIVFDRVSFSYPERSGLTLSDIAFEIKAGETVALVGESGVGKTTLLELLGGYYRPDKGEIFFDGYALSELPLRLLRSNMATVPQEPILLNESIRENLEFANRDATLDEIENAARAAHAHDFITGFPEGYDTKVGDRGLKLSVGQKQRIAIARAILRDPTILILDEPTSALDAKTERTITESLEKLMEGRTTIIIAHRLSTVRKADKIIVLDKGRIAEIGTHEELLEKEGGVYRNLHELQTGLS